MRSLTDWNKVVSLEALDEKLRNDDCAKHLGSYSERGVAGEV